MPPNQTTETKILPRLRYRTDQQDEVLKLLAKYEVLAIRDLSHIIFKNETDSALASIVRTTRILERQKLINRIKFLPEGYEGTLFPFACGLTEKGVQYIYCNFGLTDLKVFARDHSKHTIEHELKRARFHIKVSEMCKKHGLELFWRKTDLNHTVKPDDVFAIKKDGKITYYFFELENKKKSFKEMLEKYRRYEEYYGTDKCKEEWKDFKTFTVVTQIRTEEARLNLLRFLSGEPVTEYRNGHGRKIVNTTPIKRNNFWFSAESDPFSFFTSRDFPKVEYSFLSI